MWRWLLIILTLASVPAALAADSEVGPTRPGEAAILWKDSQKALKEERYADAIPDLERLIDRYPGTKDYLEAHLLLGESLLGVDDPERAIAPLKYYVQARAREVDGLRARLALAEAYLRVSKYNEAQLDMLEIERSKQAPKDVRAEGLLLKARAMIGLDHDSRAHSTVDSAEKLATGFPPILGEAAEVELELKARACARLPSARRLEEGQVQDQLSRRGTCLLEALLVYRDALNLGTSRIVNRATDQMVAALEAYQNACRNPPAPPPLKPYDRDAKQSLKYREELGSVLEQDCKKRYKEARDIVTDWKKSLPATTSPQVDEVLKRLDALENGEGKAPDHDLPDKKTSG